MIFETLIHQEDRCGATQNWAWGVQNPSHTEKPSLPHTGVPDDPSEILGVLPHMEVPAPDRDSWAPGHPETRTYCEVGGGGRQALVCRVSHSQKRRKGHDQQLIKHLLCAIGLHIHDLISFSWPSHKGGVTTLFYRWDVCSESTEESAWDCTTGSLQERRVMLRSPARWKDLGPDGHLCCAERLTSPNSHSANMPGMKQRVCVITGMGEFFAQRLLSPGSLTVVFPAWGQQKVGMKPLPGPSAIRQTRCPRSHWHGLGAKWGLQCQWAEDSEWQVGSPGLPCEPSCSLGKTSQEARGPSGLPWGLGFQLFPGKHEAPSKSARLWRGSSVGLQPAHHPRWAAPLHVLSEIMGRKLGAESYCCQVPLGMEIQRGHCFFCPWLSFPFPSPSRGPAESWVGRTGTHQLSGHLTI